MFPSPSASNTGETAAAASGRVVTLGESMILLTAQDQLPLDVTDGCSLGVAGAESNVALYLADAGIPVGWVSAVGTDPFGGRMLHYLDSRGVDTTGVHRDGARRTGVFFKNQGPGGTTVHYYRAGSAASAMGEGTLETLGRMLASGSGTRILHLSGITAALSDSCRELSFAAMALARESNVAISFDVNYRAGLWPVADAAPVLQELANQADLVLVGLDEAQDLWGLETAAQLRDHLPGAGEVVVKDGGNGATWLGPAPEIFAPAPAVDVVEVVGAGDAFAAGFLAARLAGHSLDRQLANGHRFAERAMSTTADFRSLADFASAQAPLHAGKR